MCKHRAVLASFVFRLSSLSLSLLCSCAHRWVPVSFPFICACQGIARWVLLLLFSSYSYSASFVFVRVKLKRLRLSRQAVKFGHVALFESFNEPGWATTSRCDTPMKNVYSSDRLRKSYFNLIEDCTRRFALVVFFETFWEEKCPTLETEGFPWRNGFKGIWFNYAWSS